MAKDYRPFLDLNDKPMVEEIKALMQKKHSKAFRLTDKGIISIAIQEYRDKLKKEMEG